MNQFPLILRQAPKAVRPPVAWFIPGNDVPGWIAEMLHWDVPMDGLRLLVIPTSLRDRTPIGVLVVPAKRVKPGRWQRAQAYGLAMGRVYLPVDGVLDPPVSESELSGALHLNAYVLHPAAGLVGFAADEELRVADLMVSPRRREVDWSRAVLAPAVAAKLVSVEPTEAPDVMEIIDLGRDDIGSEAGEPLSRGADESSLGKVVQWVALPLLAAASLSSSLPLSVLGALGRMMRSGQAGGQAGWLNAFNSWASENLSRLSKSLLDARARELDRLMRMLDTDPEEGLRHAIPLHGPGSRGLAPPGARLGPRDTNFNLSRLFGGGRRSDPWDMPQEAANELRRRYREAANREMRLGHYRRAAYIFAQLLGDFASAANALEQGRSFREAAVLYREHLNNPAKAAECLEKGGLLLEAVRFYEDLKQHEKAGDLYRQLDMFEDAQRCYRQQVGVLVGRGDDLAAARLLEAKLAVPDEALAVLNDAWPARDSTGQCLREYFGLLGRLARHEVATYRLRQFRKDGSPGGRAAALVGVMTAVATEYPESAVRTLGADATRVVAGRELSGRVSGDIDSIARAVGRLVPQDKLLSRDIERFLSRKTTRPSVKLYTRHESDPVVLRQFQLNEDVVWKSVAVLEDGFCAVGGKSEALILLRGTWDGRLQSTSVAKHSATELHCTLHPIPGKPVALLSTRWHQLHSTVLPPTDAMPNPLEFAVPAWLRERNPRAIVNSSVATWVLESDALNVYRVENGALMASYALPQAIPAGPVSMVTAMSHVYATWDAGYLHHRADRSMNIEKLPLKAMRLAASVPQANMSIVAAMSEGAAFWQLDSRPQVFADGMFEPFVTFTRGGLIAAADEHDGRVYRVEEAGIVLKGHFTVPGKSLLALTRTSQLDEFASFTTGGTVTVYKVPQRR